jgi:non-ribosomal peptide synthetase-like protein
MQQLSLLAPWHAIHGTPLFNVMLRAMGARVGRDVFLGSVFFELPHLLDIGDGASVGSFTILSNIVVERGEFVVGTVRIGREANVGSSAVVAVGAAVGDFAQLKSQSSLAAGVRIPDREVWDGSPARCVATGRQTGARPGATWWRVHVAEPLLFVLLVRLPRPSAPTTLTRPAAAAGAQAVVGELVFYVRARLLRPAAPNPPAPPA